MKIPAPILRIQKSLHTWVGLGAGMLLFIGFVGGALTMFKEPLEEWVTPPSHQLPGTHNIDGLVKKLLTQHPSASQEFTLKLNSDLTGTAHWTGESGGHELKLTTPGWQASLNEQGELITQAPVPSLLTELIDQLHRTGGIPLIAGGEYLGTYVMGVAAILYFLALVSGVILLLPTLVKDFFALRQGKNRKRFWLDAHNVVGIASLPFHIVISLTVIVFAFHDQFYDALAEVVYGDRPMFGAPPHKPQTPYKIADMVSVGQLVTSIQQEAPAFAIKELRYMRLESPRPMVRAAISNSQHMVRGASTGYLVLSPYTGKVTDTSMLPGKQNVWSQWLTPFFSLHFGSYGGDLIRWVYFILGLSGAFLFYSGNLLWVESRRKLQKQGTAPIAQTRTTCLMAAATVGVCLGSIAGMSTTLAASKWLQLYTDNINLSYLGVYYSVFLGAVIWAFWRGAAKAAVEILGLSALASLIIPLTSLIALVAPATGLWAHSEVWGVDATALGATILLAMGAKLTWKRMTRGAMDSVWSGKHP